MSKEEIENILGNINFEVETEQEWLEPLGLDRNTWKQILNYITNLQEENKQLKEENKKINNMLYKYRRNINNLYSYLYDKDGIAIICDIKKLFEILGDKENE